MSDAWRATIEVARSSKIGRVHRQSERITSSLPFTIYRSASLVRNGMSVVIPVLPTESLSRDLNKFELNFFFSRQMYVGNPSGSGSAVHWHCSNLAGPPVTELATVSS